MSFSISARTSGHSDSAGRRHHTVRWRRARFALAAAAALVSPLGAETGIQRTLPVAEAAGLRVEVSGGALEVSGRAGDLVSVEIRRGGDSPAEIEKDYAIVVEQRGEELVVSVEPRRPSFFFGWRRGVEVDVAAPPALAADLRTAGGSIRLGDWTGAVRAESSGGSLRVEGGAPTELEGRTAGGSIVVDDVSGNADLRTGGGAIQVGEVAGTLTAHTSGGSIDVDRVAGACDLQSSGGSIDIAEAGGTLRARTSGGGIRATLAGQPTGDTSLSASGGSVTLQIAGHLRFDLDAQSSGGGVSSDLPVTVSGRLDDHELRGTINGGGPALVVRTSGGGIRLRVLP